MYVFVINFSVSGLTETAQELYFGRVVDRYSLMGKTSKFLRCPRSNDNSDQRWWGSGSTIFYRVQWFVIGRKRSAVRLARFIRFYPKQIDQNRHCPCRKRRPEKSTSEPSARDLSGGCIFSVIKYIRTKRKGKKALARLTWINRE